MSQRRPLPDDLKEALTAATQMRAEDNDIHHVAKWLQRFHGRCQGLEELLIVTDRFLRFGMPEHELSEMRRLVERLREADLSAGDSDAVDSTLPL